MKIKEKPRPRSHIFVDEFSYPIYQELAKTREDELAPFKEMKDLFMLATFVGYQQEIWAPPETNRKEIFLWRSLTEEDYLLSLLRALALAKTGEIGVLTDERHIQSIAEGYANGGITVIREQVEKSPGDKLQNLLDFLLNWEPYKGLVTPIG